MNLVEPAHAQLPNPDRLWREGWYRFARPLASPNCGPRPAQALVDLVVLHCISLPPGQYGGSAVQQLFLNQLDWEQHPYYDSIRGLQVSSHFYVQRSGALWQFVSCDMRAWHAGESHYRGRDNCNDDSIGIELEGSDDQPFEPAQYETLASLGAAVTQRYPISYLAGHEHIAPGRKSDPGRGFVWTQLQQALGLGPQCFPEGCLD